MASCVLTSGINYEFRDKRDDVVLNIMPEMGMLLHKDRKKEETLRMVWNGSLPQFFADAASQRNPQKVLKKEIGVARI